MASGACGTTVLLALALGLAALQVRAGEAPVTARHADFVKLGPPEPGEWRYVFQEPVQTFEEYKKRMGRDPCGGRGNIRLVPFGEDTEASDDESLRLLGEFIHAYFMTGVELESVRPLPDSVRRRPSRGFGTQVLAEDVLREMSEMSCDEPGEALWGAVKFAKAPVTVARLGIVQTDLYGSSPGGAYLNFVFGMGAYGQGVAVISPARYSIRYEPEGVTPRKRVFKVAAHEIGHVFGLAHCQTYRCCMNGSNSLPESDRRPIHLCPECLRKLEWQLGFNRWDRYRALIAAYRKLGWHDEADFAARRAVLDPALLAPGVTDPRDETVKGAK